MKGETERLRRLEGHYLKDLLREAREFISTRGTYYYGHDMRGPGAELVKRIDEVLKTKDAA